MIALSQNPARQSPEQQAAPLVQAAPTTEHAGPVGAVPPPASGAPPPPGGAGFPPPCGGVGCGASHMPLVQLEVQQSAPVWHGPAAAVQTTVQVMLALSQ
jgi:hypothetical protein